MTNTIQIRLQVPATVDTFEIKLPYYFTSGNLVKTFCCMTEKYTLIELYERKGHNIQIDVHQYDDQDEVITCLERSMHNQNFEQINEAIFHHHFSEAHRNIFYAVNHQLKPIQ